MTRLRALPSRMGRPARRVAAPPKKAARFYTSKEWKDLRAAKRAAGPAYCCVCGVGGRLILDHREERRDGGADLPALSELDWYCTGHHNSKTSAAKKKRVLGE